METKSEANWSASFVNVRTMLILIAVMIIAVTHLGMQLDTVPLTGQPLAQKVPKALALLSLYLAFLYFLSWFLLKFWTEFREVHLPIESLRDLDASLGEKIQRLLAFGKGPFVQDIDRNFGALNEGLTNYLNSAFGQIDGWAGNIQGRWELPRPVLRPPTAIQTFIPKVGEQIDQTAIDKMIAFHTSELSKAQTQNNDLYREGVLLLNRHAQSHKETIEHCILEFQLIFGKQQEHYKTEAAQFSAGAEIDLSKIRLELETLRTRVRNFARARTVDKFGGDFFAPLAFCLVLVSIASPQAWEDIKVSKVLARCVPPTVSCLLYEPRTNGGGNEDGSSTTATSDSAPTEP